METVYYINVNGNEIGPFHSKEAAASEAKRLKDKGYKVSAKSKKMSESQLAELFGEAENELEIEDLFSDDSDNETDEPDWDSIFNETEGDNEGEGSDDNEEINSDDNDSDNDENEGSSDENNEPDNSPVVDSFWFKSRKKVKE